MVYLGIKFTRTAKVVPPAKITTVYGKPCAKKTNVKILTLTMSVSTTDSSAAKYLMLIYLAFFTVNSNSINMPVPLEQDVAMLTVVPLLSDSTEVSKMSSGLTFSLPSKVGTKLLG